MRNVKNRDELETYLRKQILSGDYSKDDVTDKAKLTYNVPRSLIMDILSMRRNLGEFQLFILYVLTDCINPDKIETYFTDADIEVFSKQKFETETIKFPLVFKNMVQVNPDQWIGVINAKKLMQLKDAGYIYYRDETQRRLKKVTYKDKEFYEISLDRSAVRSIEESMESDVYISDDITLNMLQDVVDFSYNGNDIIIKELSDTVKLDIIDGFHRYVALSKASAADNEFDFNMELRLTNFSIEKAQQFIYQKNQKTKMPEDYSESLNQNNPANSVCKRLNEDPTFNLAGSILRRNGIVDFSELSRLVGFYYFKKIPKSLERKVIIDTTKSIKTRFNLITESDMSLIELVIPFDVLNIIMYVIQDEGIQDNEVVSAVKYLLANKDSIPKTLFVKNKNPRGKLVNTLAEMINRWRENDV